MMQLIIAKGTFLRVPRKHLHMYHIYSLQSNNFTLVQSYSYRSVVIDSKLTWSDHITQLTADVSKTLGFMKRLFSCSQQSVRKLPYESKRPKVSLSTPHQFGSRTNLSYSTPLKPLRISR